MFTTLNRLFRRAAKKSSTRKTASRQTKLSRFRPRIETLESRLTPSYMSGSTIQGISNENILLHFAPDHNSIAVYSNSNEEGTFTGHGYIDLYASGGSNSVAFDDTAASGQTFGYYITDDLTSEPQLVVGTLSGGLIQPQFFFTLHNFATTTGLTLDTASANGTSNTIYVYSNAADNHADSTLNGIQNWNVNGNQGSNTLDLIDTGGPGRTYQITSNSVSLPSQVQTVVNYTGITQLELNTSHNQSIVQVNSTALGTTTTINGNAVNGLYNIGPVGSGDLYGMQGPIDVNCNTPGDVALLDNANQSGYGQADYTVTSSEVTFAGFGVLQYSGARSLTIQDNTGPNIQDVYNVNSTSVPTYLNGSGSADFFNIGDGDLSQINAPVTANGSSSGYSSVVLDDSSALANSPLSISFNSFAGPNTVTRNNFGGVTFKNATFVTAKGASTVDNLLTIGNGNLNDFGPMSITSGTNSNSVSFKDYGANQYLHVISSGGPLGLTVDDHNASTFSGGYDIEPGSVNRNGFSGLQYNALSSLTLDGAGTASGYTYSVDTGGSTSTNLAPVTIYTSGSNSTVNLGSGDLGVIGVPVTVYAAGTGNYIALDDQDSSFTGTYSITSNSVSRPGFGGLTYADAGLNLIGSPAQDVYNIASDSGNVYINGGTHGNTFNIGNGTINGIQAPVSITGAGGGNAVVVYDQYSSQNNNYTIASNSVSKNGLTALNYQGIQTLTVNGGASGGAFYTVNGTSIPTNLYGSNNNSSFNIGNGDMGGLMAPLTVEGGGSNSSLTVNDTTTAAGQNYTITSSAVVRLGAATINYTGYFARVELDTGNHSNTINLQGTASGSTFIVPGAAGDAINVTNSSHSLDGIGAVLVVDSYGASTVTMDDSGHTVGDSYQLTNESVSIGRSNAFLLAYFSGVGGGALGGIAHLNLVTSSGMGNAINVASTSVPTTVSGASNSSILVGGGDLGTVNAPVTVSGANTPDSVILDDQNATFQGTYMLTPGAVSRPGFGGLTYNGVNNLAVVGSFAYDYYDVSDAVANTHLHLGNGILLSPIYGNSNSAISDGVLNVTGSLTDPGGVSVADGAALTGTGSVIGSVSVAGILAPGSNGSGQLNTGNLNLASGSTFVVGQLDSSQTQENATGAVNLGGATLVLPSNLSVPVGGQIVLINNDGTDPVVGTFASLPEGSTITNGGREYTISYRGGDSNDVVLTQVAPPTVAGVQVNDGSAQRSEVRSITVTFSGSVAFAGGDVNAAAAFQLTHLTDGNNVALNTAVSTNSAGQAVVTLTFSGAETDPVSAMNGGQPSLADGRYQLTILSANVTGAGGIMLAGGGPNGNYVSPTDTQGGGPGELGLFRLFGDVNGDGIVDARDLGVLRSAFNSAAGSALYLLYLDADNSGSIDAIDLGQLRSRYNTNVF